MSTVLITPRTQSGAGLVEIMVALLIGSLLVGGMVKIFTSDKQGFRAQEAQARLQENARISAILLRSTVAKAGFHQNAEQSVEDVFGSANIVTGTNDNTDSTDQILDGTDTLTIMYERDGVMTDCLSDTGSTTTAPPTPPGTISTNVYRVRNDNVLVCSNGITAGFQPLIDDVEDLQILYGEDTNGDGSVDQYHDASTANFNNVLSVQLALLLVSDANVKPNAESKSYTLLDKTVTSPPAPGTDRRQRRIVERVVALRNKIL